MATYIGNNEDNSFNGTPLSDQIYGNGGNDKLNGADGDDYIDGGAGDDTITGGLGNDTLSGGEGKDVIYAGEADKVDGGAGDDQVIFKSGTVIGGGTFAGGADDDTLNFAANTSTGAIFDATTKTATFTGFEYITAHSRLNGTAGDDFVNLSGITSLKAAVSDFQIHGGAGNDTITGGIEDDIIYGDAGNDTLNGGGGKDVIYAGEADKVDGGAGDDQVIFKSGTVIGGGTFAGGADDDTLNFAANTSTGAIFDATTKTATFTGFEYITAHSRLNGTAGDDFVNLSGITSLKAAVSDFQIHGGAGNDTITGGIEDDIIYGDAGNDTLNGGGGNDTMTGGDGADTFLFAGALGSSGIDKIMDFSNVMNDRIALSKAGFSALPVGDIFAGAFKDIGGQNAVVDADDRLLYNHNTGALYYDADGSGSGAAIQFATITTHPILSSADFVVV